MHARLPLALVCLATSAALGLVGPVRAVAKNDLPRLRPSPEFRYVDAETDAEAAELLPKLLERYATPRAAASLVDLLRSKRRYPSRVPDRLTLDYACTDGKSRQFTWILPPKYTRSRPIGAVVFLHGAISQPAPGGGANEGPMFAPAFRSLGLAVLAPSTYDRVEWGSPACRDLVWHALRVLRRYVNVDEDRVFLAGDSDGGRGTYAVLETEATFFGAAVPVIGAPGGVTRFANFLNVPIFAINGAKDTIFPVDHVRQMVDGMKAAGIDLTWKLVADGGHDPRYLLTYQDEVCSFLKAHPRQPLPEKVDWQVDPERKDHDSGFPGDTFRWIRVEKTGASARSGDFADLDKGILRRGLPWIHAKREGNEVQVRTRGVLRYAILVSDQAFDLSKDIEVFTNGEKSFAGRVEPDAKVILEEARRFQDRKLVFSNRIEIDVP